MSDIDRAELRRLLAESVRPGEVFQVAYGHHYDYAVHDRAGWIVAEGAGKNWVRLIAAAVNALPGLLDALDVAESAIERVRALHRPIDVDVLQSECAAEECEHEFECPPIEMTVCKACYDLGDRIDMYNYERGGIEHVCYPCPTIQALDGGE